MKKLTLILSVFILTFHSCSSDDDSTSNDDDSMSQIDSFIGTWNQSMTLLNDVEQAIDDCDRESNFTINSDGTFVESAYSTNSEGACELDFADPGTWENLGNSIYRITYDPDIDGDIYTEDIIVNNNIFSVSYDAPFIYVFTKN